ncbi:MAG: response regulator [Alphaproteobacteria bacterium]|nr:response regulator [Alphaproteobacteria bacterium]
MTGTMTTLKEIKKLDAEESLPEIVEFQIGPLLERQGAELARLATTRNLAWREVPCHLKVHSNPGLLEQAVGKLLAHALCDTERGKILLGCRRRGDKLRIEVWSTGAGLGAKKLKEMQAEFHPTGSAVSRRNSGLGLNLTIVQLIGGLLGHTIDVRSRLGHGSVFAIEVPLANGRPHVPPQLILGHLGEKRLPMARKGIQHTVDPSSGFEPVVYLVDDDRNLLDSMKDFLQEHGRKVEAYSSAAEFLESNRADGSGCLVVDAIMPGMGGSELLQRLKEMNHSLLPAIMMTGHADVAMAVEAMKVGCIDFLEKPVRPEQLLLSIDGLLDRARDQDKLSVWHHAANEKLGRLTSREREVLDLVIQGHPNKIISHELGISQRTVENHRASVMRRTGVKTLADLIRLVMASD